MNLLDILDNYGVEYRLGNEKHKNVRKGWAGIDCVFCHSQDKYHLGISLSDGHGCSCWTCGTHRLVEVFDALNIPRRHLWHLDEAEPYVRDEAAELRRHYRKTAIKPKPKGKLKLPYGLQPELPKQHRRYLEGRGFDPDELVRLWDLQAIGIAPRLAWSIWIPVIQNGKVVTWTTRAIGDVQPKYRTAIACEEDVSIKHTLYGLDYVRDSVIVVEGPADAWRIGPGAVATFGVNFSDEQIELLSKVPRRLICFDSDEAGRQATFRLEERLRYTDGETLVCKLDSEDAGSASADEVQRLRRWLKNDDGIEAAAVTD